jgi:hypothetical protein
VRVFVVAIYRQINHFFIIHKRQLQLYKKTLTAGVMIGIFATVRISNSIIVPHVQGSRDYAFLASSFFCRLLCTPSMHLCKVVFCCSI